MNLDYEKYRNSTFFDYLHDSTQKGLYTWVADLTISIDTILPGNIETIFSMFKERSNKMGANAFRVNESDIYSAQSEKFISISIFWLKMEGRNQNLQLFKNPIIYLFGFLGYHQKIPGYELKINDAEFIMQELRYRTYNSKIGETTYLQQGSKIRGDSRSITFENNQYPKYFYFSRITSSYKNCFIGEYDLNFGEFLLKILNKG